MGFPLCSHGAEIKICKDIIEKIFDQSISEKDILPLTGGLSNETYRIKVNNQDMVVRFNMKNSHLFGINRDRELFFHGFAAMIGISPNIVYSDPNHQVLITRYIESKTPSADEIKSKPMISKVVALIKKCHQQRNGKKGSEMPYLIIKKYITHFRKDNKNLPATLEDSLKVAEKLQALFSNDSLRMSHNDLFSRNILINDRDELQLIDWEHANWGSQYYDLASLAEEDNFNNEEKAYLLKCYFEQVNKDTLLHFKSMCALYRLQSALWAFMKSELVGNSGYDYNKAGWEHYEIFLSLVKEKNLATAL